jgi:hypothetical protein
MTMQNEQKQSVMETTLPPGYWISGDNCSWMSRAKLSRSRFKTQSDYYRSAWRHWTAAVLRGRMIKWEYHSLHSNKLLICARTQSTWVELNPWGSISVKTASEDDNGFEREITIFIGSNHDIGIDEAMARFAALVFASEGM